MVFQKYMPSAPGSYKHRSANLCPCGFLLSCHSRNIDRLMAELDVHRDGVVYAALSHAAAIRRTLWMQKYKRKHGRALPLSVGATKLPTELSGHKPRKAEAQPILDGPIYSTEFWRTWKNRSRAGIRGGGRRNNSQHVSDPETGHFLNSLTIIFPFERTVQMVCP